MKFSNTGRVPDYIFGVKEKMEKQAQLDEVEYDLYQDPTNYKEHLNKVGAFAADAYNQILVIKEKCGYLYDDYEALEEALAPQTINNPLDLAMSLIGKLSKELYKLSSLSKIADNEVELKKMAQDDGYDGYDDYYINDLEEMGNQEGWEDGQAEMQSAMETDVYNRHLNNKRLPFPELTKEYSNTSVVYDRFEIVPEVINNEVQGYSLVAHGEFTDSSMSAGQYSQVKVDFFDTIEEAQRAYPGVPVSDDAPLSSKWLTGVPDTPPRDWSPEDAGEVWGEDDY